ncbi:DUF2953 domain-containing protein [Methanosarcina sp. UBA411]|jgi:hypothetical protein|uniref:DUF2953 domain-containing protein n=1 Tax=Methanosarcina sp. UBA411 TaxID=1915589 RepID=UPI0025D41441|nr:DUF2953 domain-containing protein [Methanosarcina sp. UBA411]
MLVITLLLLAFLLILFILFTAIGLTFKLKVLILEEKKELRGLFTVKWLLFSHTFSIEEPGENESFPEEPEKSEKDKTIKEEQSAIGLEEPEKVQVTSETQSKAEVKRKREIEEKKAEEKSIEVGEGNEKRIKVGESREKGIEEDENKEKGIKVGESEERRKKIDEDEGKKPKINKEDEKQNIISKIRGKKEPETEETPETGMTTQEIFHWGLEAYKALRKPLFRLFSDLLNGIKIKRLESCVTFGLSDPAETGMLCGFIHAIAGLAYSRCRKCSFSINPVFINPMMDFRGNMEISVRIYSLIFPMLKFMFDRKTLSFTYSIIKEKLWGKRKFNS